MNSNMLVPSAHSFSMYRFPQTRANRVAEILRGLRRPQKVIDPKLFYDAHGSQLYEKITRTFDYYVTRSENEILRRYVTSIAAAVGGEAVLIEPGSGNCKKIEYLLDALHPTLYVPIDISVEVLEAACSRLASRYEWLSCFGIASDFKQFGNLADLLPDRRRIVFFPGSTIGNYEPEVAVRFLRIARKLMRPDGGILIGVDNLKSVDVLERAYNDSAGFTAAFNKNALTHINRIAMSDFNPEKFEHRAYFNSDKSRIEMHLVSLFEQRFTWLARYLTLAWVKRFTLKTLTNTRAQRFVRSPQRRGLAV